MQLLQNTTRWNFGPCFHTRFACVACFPRPCVITGLETTLQEYSLFLQSDWHKDTFHLCDTAHRIACLHALLFICSWMLSLAGWFLRVKTAVICRAASPYWPGMGLALHLFHPYLSSLVRYLSINSTWLCLLLRLGRQGYSYRFWTRTQTPLPLEGQEPKTGSRVPKARAHPR